MNDKPDTVIVTKADDVSVVSPHFVEFKKPYNFEGKTYSGIDLGGLENLTAADMIDAEKHLAKTGVTSVIPEMTMEYVTHIAVQVSNQPIEFFRGLPPRDAIRVKNEITAFFYGED